MFQAEFVNHVLLVYKIMFIVGIRSDNVKRKKRFALMSRCVDVFARFDPLEETARGRTDEPRDPLVEAQRRLREIRDAKRSGLSG